MARSETALKRIVPRPPEIAPAYRALVRTGLRRVQNGVRSLPLVLRLEILGLAVLSVVLLATSTLAALAALLVGLIYRDGPFPFARRAFSWKSSGKSRLTKRTLPVSI